MSGCEGKTNKKLEAKADFGLDQDISKLSICSVEVEPVDSEVEIFAYEFTFDDEIIAPLALTLPYDAYRHDMTTTTANLDAMKKVLSLSLNFAIDAIQFAFIGVSAINMALEEVLTFAIDTKYESTKAMYDAYYARSENKRSAVMWYIKFQQIYKNNRNDAKLVGDLIEKEIDNYVNEYWKVAESDWASWTDAYDENGSLTKYPCPSKRDRDKISANHKKEVMSYVTSVLNVLSRQVYFDLMDM